MRRSLRWLPIGLLVVLAGCSGAAPAPEPTGPAPDAPEPAPTVEVRADLAEVFADAGVDGTFVLYDATGDRLVLVNPDRAERRLVPASTFKIPHSLIALETGAVADEHEIITYGGEPQPFEEWEQDMDLRDAVQASNAAVFQELADRIGARAEREWMTRLGYGNAQVGSTVDRFWLDGPLLTSAVEQARWLVRLARQELPASAAHQQTVADIVRLEETGSYTLYGKTGWAFDLTPQLGWWVGWVERGPATYGFALNLDLDTEAQAADRVPLGRELLSRLDILPAEGTD